MKRSLAALTLLALPLAAGCASLYGYPGDTGGYYDGEDLAYDDDAYSQRTPLNATLYESQGGLRVSLNRRAHVAIFEIEPGRGVGLLYPGYGGERRVFDAGYSRVSFSSARPYAWYLDSDPLGYYRRNPRYFLLVASRHPLRLSRIHDGRGSMRSLMGYQSYHSLNANRVMNDLVDMVLVPQRDEDWDTDVVTMWPNGRNYSRYGYGYGDYGWDNDPYYWDRMVQVRCPGGMIRTVPYHRAEWACYGVHNPRRPHDPRNPPPVRGDTTRNDSVTRPGRRRPGEPIPGGGEARGEGELTRPGSSRPGGTVDRPRVGDAGEADPDGNPAINIRRRRFENVDGRGAVGGGRPAGEAGERPRVQPGGSGSADGPDERPRITPRPSGATRPRAETPQEGASPRAEEPVRESPTFRPRPRGEEPSRPAERPREEPRRPEVRQEPREQPRRPEVRQEPREEPRRPEVRQEPREEPRRPEVRQEPRETPRAEPRSEPRAEPRREEPRSRPTSEGRRETRSSSSGSSGGESRRSNANSGSSSRGSSQSSGSSEGRRRPDEQ